MLNVFVDESAAKVQNMNKHNRRLHLMYSEDSFRERMGCVRGTIEQKETASCVTFEPMDLHERTREHYTLLAKTNRGTAIGPLTWTSWAVKIGEDTPTLAETLFVNRDRLGHPA
jgi:hypothetical protein